MRLLFPLDGSAVTYAAVERTLAMFAAHPKASATFLVVISKALRDMPKEAREHLEYDDEDELFIRDDEAKAVLDKAAALAKKVKFPKSTGIVLAGKVKELILAESAKHDVLVMHHLEKDRRVEERRGSATEELARNAKCGVLLMRGD
jgi:nucleotide-binding universal stress UspA family protein